MRPAHAEDRPCPPDVVARGVVPDTADPRGYALAARRLAARRLALAGWLFASWPLRHGCPTRPFRSHLMTFPTRVAPSAQTRPTTFVAVLAVLAVLAGCASATARPARQPRAEAIPLPVTVTRGPLTVGQCSGGSKDRAVTFKSVPQRIVTLDPQAAEFLVALGLRDRIAGTWAMYDERTLARLPQYAGQLWTIARLGNGRDPYPSPQVIAALRPDVVVTTGRLDAPGAFDATTLERTTGIPTFGFTNHCTTDAPSELDPVLADVAALGHVFDASFLADQLRATLRGQFDRAAALGNAAAGGRTRRDSGALGRPAAAPGSLVDAVMRPYAISGTVSVHLGEAVLELAGQPPALDAA
jgi:hypothetical protein